MEDIRVINYIKKIESSVIEETKYGEHKITIVPEKFEGDDFYDLQLITRICNYFEDHLEIDTSYSPQGFTIYW